MGSVNGNKIGIVNHSFRMREDVMTGKVSDENPQLTHLNAHDEARIVDVGAKAETVRRAVASAVVRTRPDVIALIAAGEMPKGDVAAVARVAGIMAAKRTASLIPLCHPIPIDAIEVEIQFGEDVVNIRATVTNTAKTGVEMEALTAASVASLAVYDMCKAVDRSMTIEAVRLEAKSGGRSGDFVRGDG